MNTEVTPTTKQPSEAPSVDEHADAAAAVANRRIAQVHRFRSSIRIAVAALRISAVAGRPRSIAAALAAPTIPPAEPSFGASPPASSTTCQRAALEPIAAPLPRAPAPRRCDQRADAGAQPASDEARWNALAEEIRMQVLQRIDIFTDTGLREQLNARLQPIVDRASADLVAAINQHVGQLLREYVAEAIEREIEKWRAEKDALMPSDGSSSAIACYACRMTIAANACAYVVFLLLCGSTPRAARDRRRQQQERNRANRAAPQGRPIVFVRRRKGDTP